MNENEIIDAESRKDFYDENPRYRYATTIFALLDVVSVLILFTYLISSLLDGG
ncbi:MAG: hypothetical protein ACI8ZM_003751, partial [Crocinitomix sp.]